VAVLAVLCGAATSVSAQSPYGLAARQAIPWVMEFTNDRPWSSWMTEIDVHNPAKVSVTVVPTYLGAVATPTPGRHTCNPITVGPGQTAEFPLFAVCPLAPGLNYGRLELSALIPGGTESPSDSIFLANARVSYPGATVFTVEGFPEGNLSGNRSTALVTGLKNGLVNGYQWRSFCGAAALNDPTAVVVRLFDGSGNPVGIGTGAPLDPPSSVEMEVFPDVFAAVGAPSGSQANVTAAFSSLSPTGAGVFGFCLVENLDTGDRAFEVAKYLDNNDEGREYRTAVNETSYGQPFAVVSEVTEDLMAASNFHVAYFQHPDRVYCEVTFSSPHSTFDQVQMRLIDPDGQVVAGGPHQTTLHVDLGEKPQRYGGRNGRWLVEVAPDRTYLGDCDAGILRYVCPGKAEMTPYTLTCSSGNGHNQLDFIGHAVMLCAKDGAKEALCAFANPPFFWTWY
jgi:hypothetical protein